MPLKYDAKYKRKNMRENNNESNTTKRFWRPWAKTEKKRVPKSKGSKEILISRT